MVVEQLNSHKHKKQKTTLDPTLKIFILQKTLVKEMKRLGENTCKIYLTNKLYLK